MLSQLRHERHDYLPRALGLFKRKAVTGVPDLFDSHVWVDRQVAGPSGVGPETSPELSGSAMRALISLRTRAAGGVPCPPRLVGRRLSSSRTCGVVAGLRETAPAAVANQI